MKKTLLAVVLLGVGGLSLHAAEFYVATDGNDGHPGNKEQPFASFERAQKAVRAVRVAEPKAPVTVTFQTGVYPLSATLNFTAEDSGASEEAPVRYMAAKGAQVVISGGTSIGGWQADSDLPGVWKTQIPTQGDWRFEQLWVNDQRAVRARTPNYWNFARLVGVWEDSIEGEESARTHTFMLEEDAISQLAKLTPETLQDAQIHVFHKWDTTREWIRTLDSDKGLITCKGGKMQPWNSMAVGCLYHLENYKGAMDAEGEWFLDRDGWIYYIPRQGEDMTQAAAVYPRLTHLLKFQGGEGNKRVQYVEFEGLKFRHAGYRVPLEGVPAAQAAMICEDAAIALDHASNITFRRCAVEHIGTTAFWFQADCHNCSVDTSRMFDLGASGVRIGQKQIVPEPVRTGNITINDCIIQTGGRIHPSAVAVWIGQSSHNRITHNEISDFIYTGVSVGWTWGYAESGAQGNLIAYNHINHLGYKILSDMGGIYTLGNSVGTVLRGNVIHDVYSSNYGGWGLYTDEGSTGILLNDNLVYNTKDGGFHQHYGKENTVRNNIFAYSEEGQIALTRPEEHTSIIFENNIVVFDKGQLLGYGGWAGGAKVKMNNNLYWNTAGNPITFAGKTFDEWKASGKDTDSLIADPLFVDVAKRDFHFKEGSSAEKIGFKPFDFSQAGVYGNAEWVALAKAITFPGFGNVLPSKPLKISEDFESPTASLFMSLASFNTEQKPELVARTDKYAVSGKYSLTMKDAPDMKYSYDPHFCWDPNSTAGTLSLGYKIRLETGCVTHNEIRSEGNPYLVGPSLFFRDGGLTVQGKKIADLPYDQWIDVQILAPLGEQAKGTWSLKLTLADGTVQEFPELTCNPEWNRARWIGFCALENTSSSFYLDDLRLELLQE